MDVWSDEHLGAPEVRWWGPYFYAAYRQMAEGKANPLTAPELNEILARCRFLREQPRQKGEQIAAAGFIAWTEILQKFGYDAVQPLPMDAFVYDTLVRAAERLGIPAFGPIGTSVPGNFRFTLRGPDQGRLPDSEADRDAFEDFYAKLAEPSFRPSWVVGTSTQASKTAQKRLLIDLAKPAPFAAYRTLKRDPLSFSFSPFRFQKKLMTATPERYTASLEMEKFAQKQMPSEFALIPLQFYPEASTDYWIPELEVINHHKTVLAITEMLKSRLPVIIKEHPAAVGRRDAGFLRALMAMDNVYFAPLLYPMGTLVSEAQLVIGHGSSSMLQGLCLDRRQLFIGTPYYGSAGRPILKSVEPKHLEEVIDRSLNDPLPSKDVAKETLWELFCKTAPGSLGQYSPLLEKSVGNVGMPNITEKARLLLETAYDQLQERQPALTGS